MNNKMLENIMTDYNKKRLKAFHDADLRKEKLYAAFPELEEAEKQVQLLSIKLSKLYLSNLVNLNEQVLMLKDEIEQLKNKRKEIYTKNNIPEDYLKIRHECNKCGDTGYIDGKKCSCFNKQIISNLFNMSNMEHMLKKENFNTFDINIFSN